MVSWKNELPPSMMMSPFSSRGVSSAITSSMGLPAFTMMKAFRGEARLATNSAMVFAGSRRLPLPGPSTRSRVFSYVRLYTATV